MRFDACYLSKVYRAHMQMTSHRFKREDLAGLEKNPIVKSVFADVPRDRLFAADGVADEPTADNIDAPAAEKEQGVIVAQRLPSTWSTSCDPQTVGWKPTNRYFVFLSSAGWFVVPASMWHIGLQISIRDRTETRLRAHCARTTCGSSKRPLHCTDRLHERLQPRPAK